MYVGGHEGGFDGFTMDITEALQLVEPLAGEGVGGGLHELVVQVWDPSNRGGQPFGKQRTEAMWSPGGDTYTPVSGIWQPVWLETVPARHVTSLKLRADMTQLNLTVFTNTPDGGEVQASVLDGGVIVATAVGRANMPFRVAIPAPKLWSPETPFLYRRSIPFTIVVQKYSQRTGIYHTN
jgi:hypothetical protein